MFNKKIMLSHSDMDGVGCSILMNSVINGIETQYVGYQQLHNKIKQLSEIEADYLFITDIHLTNELLKLVCSNKSFKKIVYIDHHEYEDKKETLRIIKEDGRFTYNLDTSDSATWLVHQMLSKKQQFTPELTKLAKLIDIYDSWKSGHEAFDRARDFDALFWHYGLTAFEARFKDGLNLSKIEVGIMNGLKEERLAYIKDSIENYSQEINKNAILIHNPACKYISSFALDAPYYPYYVIMSNVKDEQITLSFRFHSTNEDTFQNMMSKVDQSLIIGCGGHKKSGSFHLKIDNMEAFINNLDEVLLC